MCPLITDFIYYFLFLSAEDWLKPNVVIGAFEARAARMSVAVAQNLSKFANPEEGKWFIFCLNRKLY